MDDTMMRKICGSMNLPDLIVKESSALYREFKAKNVSLGKKMSESCVIAIFLHLVADKKGHPVDIKTVCKIAGAKTKPDYMNKYQNITKIMNITNTLNLQELAVQVGCGPGVVSYAREAVQLYQSDIVSKRGKQMCQDIDWEKSIYLCSALVAASKLNKAKIDINKLVDIAKHSKKEITDVSDEMFKLLTENKSKTGKKSLKSLQEEFDEIENVSVESKDKDNNKRKTEEETDLDPAEAFQAWKQDILKRAVQSGFSKYKKFIIA